MKNLLKKTIATGTIAAFLAIPGVAATNDIIPINYEAHWAQSVVIELSENSEFRDLLNNKNLNSVINLEDFQKAVKILIDEKYEGNADSTTREAVTAELVNIWSQKTGINLNEVPILKMIFYSDFSEIDSKYAQGINVAYMKNIAKGRGEGIFAPKANVTYGELAAFIKKTNQAINGEKGIAAGKFETRADYSIKDGKITFDFELFSHYTQRQDLIFGSGQQFEVTVEDEKGNEVYRFSDGKAFTLALVMKSIEPGESLVWQDVWDMIDKEGNKAAEGNYKATIKILVIHEEGEKPIPEEQLTKVIDFTI